MRLTLSMATLFVAANLASAVRADGLLYRLPKDGTSAQFDLEFTVGPTGTERKGMGTLAMSSVGETTVNDEKCRWIEFKFTFKRMGQQDPMRMKLVKVLIPEKHLEKGRSPGENMVRGWFKEGDGNVQELRDLKHLNLGPLPLFLSGPLQVAQELVQIEIDSVLGKLDCVGQSGRNKAVQGENASHAEFENRLHEKAPFGVVTSRIRIEVRCDGHLNHVVNVSLKLAKVGSTPRSELPDWN
jgi:hypothetical protein